MARFFSKLLVSGFLLAFSLVHPIGQATVHLGRLEHHRPGNGIAHSVRPNEETTLHRIAGTTDPSDVRDTDAKRLIALAL